MLQTLRKASRSPRNKLPNLGSQSRVEFERIASNTGFKSPGEDHFQNFVKAVKSRRPEDLNAEIEKGHISAALCHLGNISYRTGHKLHLEAGPKFTNDSEANKMLTRDYRKPYVV